MKKRIGIFYKKENPNVISSAVLNVDREMIEILGISIKENDIKFCREPMNRIGINNFRSEKRYFEMICHKVV